VKPTFSQTFMGIINCRTSISRADLFEQHPIPGDAADARDVPNYLVPRPGDDSSVGELTATTHEMRVDIETFKQSLIASKEEDARKTTPAQKMAEMLHFGSREKQAGDGAVSFSDLEMIENYFSEYDDYSVLSPEMAAAAEAVRAHRKPNKGSP
jgi:hypothetical protein